jgi:NAD(P)H dehydrogenase (quinone)
MKVLVILAHPQTGSFNHALAETSIKTLEAKGHQVFFHDLYLEKFPPVLPAEEIPRDVRLPKIIQRHCSEIAQAEGIVIIHPNWWGQPPAILKGWIDRVLRPGVAYSFAEGDKGDGELIGLLKADTIVVFNTCNTPQEREMNVYGDPLELLWKNNLLVSCGVKNYFRKTFGVMITSSPEQRKQWLVEAQEIIGDRFP